MVIIIFGLPLTYAYATLWQSVAGNSTFRGIVFCNLGTPKQSFQISSPRGKLRPHIFPHMVTPTMFPVDKKTRAEKKVSFIFVLIPWCPISYLTIASSVFFVGRLRLPTRRCNLVVPADGGWGRSNKLLLCITVKLVHKIMRVF
jgi:hypothetical protein